MPFDVTLQGTEVIITDSDTGDHPNFDSARSDIIKKEAKLVINKIIISYKGFNYTIDDGLKKLQTGLSYDEILTPDIIKKYSIQHLEKTENEKKALDNAIKSADWSSVSDEVKEAACANVILTTSMFLSCREIEYEIDVITYECAYGMNIFRDLFASVRDMVGGRSKAVETVLRDARKVVMRGLREEALNIGADAVIAIDIDYSELSGGGKSGMLVAIATGTAVKLK